LHFVLFIRSHHRSGEQALLRFGGLLGSTKLDCQRGKINMRWKPMPSIKNEEILLRLEERTKINQQG